MNTFPDWATPGENRKLFGNARALVGADDLTLSDRDATLGFVEQKSAGKFNVFRTFPKEFVKKSFICSFIRISIYSYIF